MLKTFPVERRQQASWSSEEDSIKYAMLSLLLYVCMYVCIYEHRRSTATTNKILVYVYMYVLVGYVIAKLVEYAEVVLCVYECIK